jgi:ribosomal-protein-alanine N-acetyltransferase
MSGAFPELNTERLRLRQVTPGDADALLAHYADAEMLRYMDFGAPTSLAQARGIVDWGLYLWEVGEGILWVIEERQSGALAGTLNYEYRAGHRAQITYDLARAYWGRGYMPEAVRSTLPYLFEEAGVTRIETLVHVQNVRSVRVLAKLGFQAEGLWERQSCIGGVMCDMLAFALLKENWQR